LTLLHHKTILITRRREQSAELQAALERHGAQVVFLPTIQVIPPQSWEACDAALARFGSFDLIVFTSINAVTFFLHRCIAVGISPDLLARCEMAAVGRKTGAELERIKLHVRHVPGEYSAAALLDHFRETGVRGRHILVPRGDLGRRELIEGLRGLGASVEDVTVYRTVNADLRDAEEVMGRISQGEIDVVTFASPSAVNSFAGAIPSGAPSDILARTRVAVIGPSTAEAVRAVGREPSIIASESTARGLADAIADYFAGNP